MAMSGRFDYNRSDRPEDLLIGLVSSIILHSLLFLGSKYWLQAFTPEQKSEPIPIEYVEVPQSQTKTPPPTSRVSTKDSVAGGEAKPKRPVSATKSAGSSVAKASASSPKTFSDSQPTNALPPEQSQSTALLPNLPAQKPQPKPPQSQPKPPQTQTSVIPQEPKPQQSPIAPTTPPETEPQQPPVIPPTPSVVSKLRKFATAHTTPPETEPQQPPVIPTTPSVVSKLRKFATTHTTPPETEPQQPPVIPTTPPVVSKLRKLVTAPTTPPETKPQQPPVVPTTPPVVPKLRKLVTAPTTLPETKPQQPPVVPTTPPVVPRLHKLATAPTTLPETKPQQPSVVPTGTLPKYKPQKLDHKIAAEPTSKPLTPKFSSTSKVPASTRPKSPDHPVNHSRIATQSTSLQPGTKTNFRTSSPVHSSGKSGAASRLGGPISVSRRDYGGNYMAALPNSNRLNQDVQGVDAHRDSGIAAYLQQLQERVKQQWVPELSQTSRRTVLHFTVDRSGHINGLEVAKTSGFTVTDQAALSAIKRAAPFGPLPAGYEPGYVNIQFTFDINVYGELDVWGN
jgi:TonB family protein